MAKISIRNVSKHFGSVCAVSEVTLDVGETEFLTLLGPSGCGKTTTLRMIAGLEDPDEGEIYLGDMCVYSVNQGIFVRPEKRRLGFIFQNYALWPHLTVEQNIVFGLKEKKVPSKEIPGIVRKFLEKVQMSGFENRYPSELSGGQQQRVAVARMLVTEPYILLMDEPLSNLDAKLRLEMRSELKHLHQETGATTVYVTHDQVEALTLSSRVAVMKYGVVQQVATPRELYEGPANLFVVDFIGNPKTNLIKGKLENNKDSIVFTSRDFSLPFPKEIRETEEEVTLAVRPENIELSLQERPDYIPATVYAVLPAGSESIVDVNTESLQLTIKQQGYLNLEPDERIWLHFEPDKMNFYSTRTGLRMG